MKQSIFLVEDDLNFGVVLKSYLEMNGYEVTLVDDGKDAIPEFNKKDEFDLCVLDIMLPNVDGFTIAKEIREMSPGIPLIFLSAKSMKEDIMKGFSVGADDYIVKPFDSDVLLQKIKAILKRSEQTESDLQDIVQIGEYEFHTNMRQLKHGGESQKLSPREGDLLKLLYQHKNKVLDRNFALKTIWGDDNYFNARSMDVYITKLRKYLKKDRRITINNIHSSGFILKVPRD